MIIITGANGFLGQNLAPQALKYFKSSEILCLVSDSGLRLEKEGLKILKKAGLKTLYVDLVSKKNLDKIPKNPSLVIHLAANTDTSKKDFRINDYGTANLLNAIGPLDNKTRFIFTSTAVMMSGRQDCSKPITELEIPKPTNEYGRSKLRAEKVLLKSSQINKFSLIIIRVNTIYGGDPREYKMFKVLKNNIQKKSLTSRLNWPGLTSIIHVSDVSSAILMLAKIKLPKNKPQLFILSAESLSLAEISKIMYQKMGLEYKQIKLPGLIWKIFSFCRKFIPIFEKITTPNIYNLFWRFGLIVDNVIDCKVDKISKHLPKWKPRKFINAVVDEIN